jgi:hypothetical protein
MNRDPSQPTVRPTDVFGWLMFICRALAITVEVFLHEASTFGERYFGLPAAAAALALLCFPVFWEGHDVSLLFVFLICYAAICMTIRLKTFARRRRGGDQPHTLYSGRPRLLRLVRGMSEVKVKSMLEPMLVLLTGTLVLAINEPLGTYLLLAGFALLVSVNSTLAAERQRALDMHDAFIDQRGVVDRFRDLRGE